jgi:hypothetical protein
MIDYKLSMRDDKDRHLFNLLAQARSKSELTGSREPLQDAATMNTMPYFLTSEYAALLAESKKQDEERMKQASNGAL